MAENHMRSWLAAMVADDAPSAHSSNCSPMRLPASPPHAARPPEPLRARPRGGVAGGDVRAPLPGHQEVPAAEYVERQIAIFIVKAVEEAAFLPAVERDVGIVEIEHDLARRALMRLEEEIDEQRIDPRPVAI